ncbi:MAG TPA: hypothetical protein VF761_16715 [Gemmatimonadaceae bacterium]
MKRPMTDTWPERIYVAARGECVFTSVHDADSGVSLPNTQRVDLSIGCEGFITATVTALRVDAEGQIEIDVDEQRAATFTRTFIVQPFEQFGFTCEPAETPEATDEQ